MGVWNGNSKLIYILMIPVVAGECIQIINRWRQGKPMG